jgi:hypothetical protein
MGGAAGGYAPQAPAMPAHDPYAAMRPPPGRQFDLRPVEDGMPVQNVHRGGVIALFTIGVIMAIVGGALGVGFGMGNGGRRAYNQANQKAKEVKVQLEEMHKTVTQVGHAVLLSQQRLAAAHLDALSYDPKLIEELERIKLDPRPDTSKIFKVNYFQISGPPDNPDLVVDNLMTYYYDTIALYGEVERHVKKTKADKESLEAFAAKQAEKSQTRYGIVFASGGKIVLANLVEMGQQTCKGGGSECAMDQLEGFQIRANAGANWVPRKVGAKPDGSILVPLEPTPLLESVMAGSPQQARMEQYRIRFTNIRLLLARIAATQKQLMDGMKKAAERPDLFAL